MYIASPLWILIPIPELEIELKLVEMRLKILEMKLKTEIGFFPTVTAALTS